MNLFVIGIIIFIVTVSIIELLTYTIKTYRHPDRRKIRKRLSSLSSYKQRNQPVDIVQKRVLSDVPLLNKILPSMPGIKGLRRLVIEAKVAYPAGVFILFSVVLLLSGFLVSNFVIKNFFHSEESYDVQSFKTKKDLYANVDPKNPPDILIVDYYLGDGTIPDFVINKIINIGSTPFVYSLIIITCNIYCFTISKSHPNHVPLKCG